MVNVGRMSTAMNPGQPFPSLLDVILFVQPQCTALWFRDDNHPYIQYYAFVELDFSRRTSPILTWFAEAGQNARKNKVMDKNGYITMEEFRVLLRCKALLVDLS